MHVVQNDSDLCQRSRLSSEIIPSQKNNMQRLKRCFRRDNTSAWAEQPYTRCSMCMGMVCMWVCVWVCVWVRMINRQRMCFTDGW